MKSKKLWILPLAVAPAMAGCSFFGTTLEHDTLTNEIGKTLDQEYAGVGAKVDSVTCDESNKKPKPGSTFTCEAKVRDVTVPVEVTVKDKDMNVNYATKVKLYDLGTVGPKLAPGVSKQLGDQVTVDCGTGLKTYAPGQTFPCKVKNAAGAMGTLTFTVGPMDGEDSWA